jgi:hypothetical protein
VAPADADDEAELIDSLDGAALSQERDRTPQNEEG